MIKKRGSHDNPDERPKPRSRERWKGAVQGASDQVRYQHRRERHPDVKAKLPKPKGEKGCAVVALSLGAAAASYGRLRGWWT